MKKIFRLFSMAALALTMAACSNDDNVQENAQPAEAGVVHFTATLPAPNSGAGTRTAMTEGTGGDEGKLLVAWKEGDQIALCHNGTKDVITLADADINTNGSVTISADISATDGEDVTVVYPAASVTSVSGATPTYTATDMSAQDGTLDYIAANLDRREGSGKFAVSGGKASFQSKITMSNSEIGIWKLTLQDNAATPAPVSATKVTVKDGDDVIASTTDITAASIVYLAVPAVSGANLTIEATTADGTYTFSKTGVNLSANTYYQSTVTMAPAATDLSMVDCAGNTRATMWTANCYMVHTAGNYKLPLVYGNAIKNGTTNSAAYTGVENANATQTFPNHNGDAINAPWITKSASGEGVNKGMGITVNSAELLWQDANGLITAVGIDGDYLTLTVGKDAATQEGNAVIAVKSGDDIVWSWHIWVTKQTFADATLTTVATGSHNYEVTPVNLGWVGDAVSQGYNTFYQWGRKDAFIPSTGTADANHTVYNISGTTVTGFTYSVSTEATIADNIKNPTTHYYNSSNYGPCNTTYYNMWDAQNTATDSNVATATKKTVYDPCPPGFCVPTGNLYNYVKYGADVTFGWDNTNKGRTLTSVTPNVFFPASGSRSYSYGTLSSVGSYGYAWSASPSSNSSGRYLYFESSTWYWNTIRRANGFPVRAVAEE